MAKITYYFQSKFCQIKLQLHRNLLQLIILSKVEGDPKVPFSIATTPRCRGERHCILWIAPRYPWSLLYNVVRSARRHQVPFLSLDWIWIEFRSPGQLANTLIIRPIVRQKHERGLITAIRKDTDNTTDDRLTITRKQKGEKQLYGRFKRLINTISHEKTWTWPRKGNLMRETEYLLIAAQDNAIRTNPIKARINKTQQNSKCRLCGDRDETINHIISECSKLAQREYNARRDSVGKVIHWEMCKKFKFDHTNKSYMHNPAPVQENDTHKLLWDFDLHTDHLIPARRPDIIIINKNKKKREFAKLSTLLSQLTTE